MSRPASAPACLPRSLLCPRLGKLLRPAHTGPRLITSHGPRSTWPLAQGHRPQRSLAQLVCQVKNGDGWRACSGAGGTGAGGAAQRPRPDLQRRPCQGVARAALGAPCSVFAQTMRSRAVRVLASSPRREGRQRVTRVCGARPACCGMCRCRYTCMCISICTWIPMHHVWRRARRIGAPECVAWEEISSGTQHVKATL